MPPEDRKTKIAGQWLVKAGRDLLATERSLAGDPPLRDVAAFHLQQAAEKALKGYLAWHNATFRRAHDLVYLLERCEALDSSFAQLREAAVLLTPYSTEFRYPGDVEEPTPEAIDAAGTAAREVVRFVRERLPISV